MRMQGRWVTWLGVFVVVAALAACGDDGGSDSGDGSSGDTANDTADSTSEDGTNQDVPHGDVNSTCTDPMPENECETCSCVNGTWQCAPAAPGSSCVIDDCCWTNATCQPCDGDACPAAGVQCVGEPVVPCEALDSCSTAALICDAGTCECLTTPEPDGTECDAGQQSGCTLEDKCVAGTCQPGIEAPIDDDNPCTSDACVDGEVVHTPLEGACDDGNPCTLADTCLFGECQGTGDIICDPGVCDEGAYCDSKTGDCVFVAKSNGVECDDGLGCGAGTCEDGQCLPADGSACDDGNPCTEDVCSADGTCTHAPEPDGTVCGEGSGCQQDPICDAGVCVPGGAYTCDDGLSCTTDSCVGGGECAFALPLGSTSCLIEGACVAAGDPNPADDCYACLPNVSQTTWSFDPGNCPNEIDTGLSGPGIGFDVSDDGSLTAAGWTEGGVQVKCYDAAGALTGEVTLTGLQAAADGNSNIYVARADVSKQSVVVAFPWPTAGDPPTTQTAWWLDSACALTGGPRHLQGLSEVLTGGFIEYWDLVMGDTGQTAIVYQSRNTGTTAGTSWPTLALFDGTGAVVAAPQHYGVDLCNESGNGIRVAMRETTGDVIVSCQGHSWVPVRAQRFQANGTKTDATMFQVNLEGSSAWYDSHIIGMADDGSFVAVWEDSSADELLGAFFNPSATHLATAVLGAAEGNWFDGYRRIHARIQTLAGGSYLIPGPAYQTDLTWFGTYTKAGTKVADYNPAQFPPLLRTDALGNLFALIGNKILVNSPPYSL